MSEFERALGAAMGQRQALALALLQRLEGRGVVPVKRAVEDEMAIPEQAEKSPVPEEESQGPDEAEEKAASGLTESVREFLNAQVREAVRSLPEGGEPSGERRYSPSGHDAGDGGRQWLQAGEQGGYSLTRFGADFGESGPDMAEISEFFRRDARRYDGGYRRY